MLKWDNGLFNIRSKTASLKDERTFTQHNLNVNFSKKNKTWNQHEYKSTIFKVYIFPLCIVYLSLTHNE